MTYEELGRAIGATVNVKQQAYGDSYGRAGAVLRLLFPEGVPLTAYDDMLAIVRVVDKLFRLATSAGWTDLLEESPWHDIAGYGLLGAMRAARRKKEG